MEPNYTIFYRGGRWWRAKSWSVKVGKWILGAAGGLLGLYLTATVTGIAPPPQIAHDLECRWQEWRAKPAPGTEFTILISNLADDPGSRQTKLVRNVFLGQRGIDVRRTCRVVAVDAADRSLADAEAKAVKEGQALLETRNADLLISGDVLEHNKALQLWFLSDERGPSIPSRSYSIT